MKRFRLPIDARTLIVVGLAVAVVGAYWAAVSLSRDYYVISSPPGSVFNSDDDGLQVLYNYLDALDVPVETLQNFEELPPDGTIVVAAPELLDKTPTSAEARRLDEWVEGGGRLVLVGIQAHEAVRGRLPGAGTSIEGEASLPMSLPSRYASGVSYVEAGRERLLADDAGWATHIKDIAGQVLVSRASGEGEIVWLAGIYPLSNAGIGRADNARFATLIAAGSTPVYFDEYHHGFVRGGGVWDRLGGGGRAAAVLSAAALALALLAASRRPGPAIEPLPERAARRGAYVGALAELYRRAGARAAVLRTLEEGLRYALVRRFGTEAAGRAAAPAAAAALVDSAALREGESIPRDTFMATARALAQARREVEGLDG